MEGHHAHPLAGLNPAAYVPSGGGSMLLPSSLFNSRQVGTGQRLPPIYSRLSAEFERSWRCYITVAIRVDRTYFGLHETDVENLERTCGYTGMAKARAERIFDFR